MKKNTPETADITINMSIDDAVNRLFSMHLNLEELSAGQALQEIALATGWEAILIYAMQSMKCKVE
jgi:hypothetical protein